MALHVSHFNRRGIFLQQLGPAIVTQNEVMVSMQLALKESEQDENSDTTDKLVGSTTFIASSNDGGQSFSIRNAKDVDGDGDGDDREKMIALAKAYATIIEV